MQVVFPVDCVTEASRLSFCYKAQENLRLLHNFFGEWWRDGNIIFERWDALPIEIKTKYPYVTQITETVYKQFINEEFEPISEAIISALSIARQEAKVTPVWDPGFNNLSA